eukprot:TRINITY_DN27_c0_g1_i1.p1 TRINITY_DN27_c0_g1~~TRINITY_DN27_c0_g1_i1.p1  ORF type:complete len:978 (-),score=232.32 TRINITY_DN27_c0_g1_i1:433-3366(-)
MGEAPAPEKGGKSGVESSGKKGVESSGKKGSEFDSVGGDKRDFVPSHGLTQTEAEDLLKVHGLNVLEEKATPKWVIFLKQLWGPMPILIWIAIIIEAGIENWLDMGILLAIQFINATIGWYETTKAGDAVAALKASLKPSATVKRDGVWKNIDASVLVPGDCVLLGAGSAVPADCIVNDGRIEVDQSALTGESLPVTMRGGDGAKMGSTVVRGETEATVDLTGKNTFFGKTATMLQTVNELGNLQKVILTIMFVLCAISITLCTIAFIYLLIKEKPKRWKHSLQFVVVLLVASIPIAIEIVTTCTLALGSRKLAAMNAIVTRLVAIEEMAGMNMLCSDKTGTLTLNKMVIQDECPTYTPGENKDSVLQAAALAAKWKEPPRDALDTMVLGAVDLPSLDIFKQLDFMPFDPTVKRTEGTIQHPDGRMFKTTKGAPHIILNLCYNKDVYEHELENVVHQLGLRGIRCMAVARTWVVEGQGDKWEMLGLLTFLDPPRPDTKHTIERAQEFGVAVKMITGDQIVIACETARTLGMGTNIRGAQGLPSMTADGKIPGDLHKYSELIIGADGFAQVFPEHKYLIVETLRQEGYSVGMTGDGVNDAPALKRADVGIAVSGATDAARAAADIVITSPGLAVVVEAIIIARCIFQRVKSFINYRVAATLQLICFFFIALFAFPPDDYRQGAPTFFELPVLMLMLITLLNDGTLITIGYDHVIPSQRPEKWNLRVLFTVSSVLAVVAFASSLLLLWGALDSGNRKNGLFQAFGLPKMEMGQVTTMIYLKVSLSDFLTLFSARTTSFFWTQKPGPLLLMGAGSALTLSTILACVWPPKYTDKIETVGLAREGYRAWAVWVWLYCIFWWFIQDTLKVMTYRLIWKFNIFNANAQRTIAMGTEITAGDEKGKGLAKEGEAEQELVTISYNAATGKAMSEQLRGALGKEVAAKYSEDEHGATQLSISYSKESGKALAKQIQDEIAKAKSGK